MLLDSLLIVLDVVYVIIFDSKSDGQFSSISSLSIIRIEIRKYPSEM